MDRGPISGIRLTRSGPCSRDRSAENRPLRPRAFAPKSARIDRAAGPVFGRFPQQTPLKIDGKRAWLRDEHVLAPADSVLRRAI